MSFSRLSRFSFFRSRQLAAACALCITLASALPAPVGAQPTSASQPAAAASASATAAPATSATAPAQAGFPAPPAVAARSFLLIDISANNQILAAKDIDAVMEPASLTKLMTAYVVFDALKSGKISLEQTFGVSERAWKMPGSRMFIRPNTQVPVEDLLKGMIVQSGNDASVALAEGLLGSQEAFVEQMNATAKKLGMHNTGYRNPEGLTTEGHTTTARDMALLSTRLLADFPQYTGYYAIKSYHYPGTPETNGNNRNLLLFRDPSVDGLKTGHTEEAGYCLVASAERNGQRMIAVVFGTDSEEARSQETAKLLGYGFNFFESKVFYRQGEAIQTVDVWKGAASSVKAGVTSNFAAALPKRAAGGYQARVVLTPGDRVAPLEKGAALGRVELVDAAGKVVSQAPLVALEAVEEGGFFRRMWDGLRLFFRGLFG